MSKKVTVQMLSKRQYRKTGPISLPKPAGLDPTLDAEGRLQETAERSEGIKWSKPRV
jgi:hypothetical protein